MSEMRRCAESRCNPHLRVRPLVDSNATKLLIECDVEGCVKSAETTWEPPEEYYQACDRVCALWNGDRDKDGASRSAAWL